MSKKSNREIRAEEEAEAQQAIDARSRSNRKAFGAIAAIVALGLGLAFWLTNGNGPRPNEAQAQKASKVTKVAEADLMKPGPLPDNVLGNADAKVTIVEYASMTCPHCAHFHKTVYPELKTKYIDTGKARFIFREFPLDNRAAAGSLLARCAGGDKYFAMVDLLFDKQEQWAFVKGSPVGALQAIAKQLGMSEDAFNTCINDKATLAKLESQRDIAGEKYGVNSTPTFFINGEKLAGGQEIGAFDKVIEPLLK